MTQGKDCGAPSRVLSIRLNDDERAVLSEMANGEALSTFARAKIFADASCNDKGSERLSSAARQKLLAQLLLRFGALNFEARLDDLKAAIETGAFEDTKELIDALERLHEEIMSLRIDLLRALGLRPKRGSP